MTYISIKPKNENSESRVLDRHDAVMDALFSVAQRVLQIPASDIIVELQRCTAVSFNRAAVHSGAAPDVIIEIATSDHYLQPRFPALCEQVIADWNGHLGDITLEVWVSLIDAWAANTV